MRQLQRMGVHCRCLPHSEEEAVLTVTSEVGARVDDGDDGTASAFKVEETGKCNGGGSARQVGDEDWICDGGTSTHTAPPADCMINYGKPDL